MVTSGVANSQETKPISHYGKEVKNLSRTPPTMLKTMPPRPLSRMVQATVNGISMTIMTGTGR